MKRRNFSSFFAGMLTMLLLGSLTVSALAISGRMTLEVEPINVMVNGEVFQPKDGLGRDVPVFVYRGTTYAPLRALAEAYGLEVGYDKAQNLATVTDPRAAQTSASDYSDWSEEKEKAYQEFKAMWAIEVYFQGIDQLSKENCTTLFAKYNGELSNTELKNYLTQKYGDNIDSFAERMLVDWYNNEDTLRIDYINSRENSCFWSTSLFRYLPDKYRCSTDYSKYAG